MGTDQGNLEQLRNWERFIGPVDPKEVRKAFEAWLRSQQEEPPPPRE